MTKRLALAALCVSLLPVWAQRTTNFPVIGRVVREDPRIDKLIPPNAKIEVVASGFEWCEGPLWVKDGGYLLFSDIPRNSIMKWDEKAGITLFMKPSGYTGVVDYGREPGSNGLLMDPQGRLVLCEHGDRRISRLLPDGGKQTLADNYMGKRFNSPNDGVFRSNGDLYFTDPAFGLPKQFNDPRRELDFCGVYLVTTDGKVTLLTRELSRPNGLALSPDEKTLYVSNCDLARPVIMAYPLKADGTIGAGRVHYDASSNPDKLPGLPDGMKIDKAGNLFASGPGGIHVIAPDGTRLGRITSGQTMSNCAWGNDGSMLYITSDMYMVRIKTTTIGTGW